VSSPCLVGSCVKIRLALTRVLNTVLLTIVLLGSVTLVFGGVCCYLSFAGSVLLSLGISVVVALLGLLSALLLWCEPLDWWAKGGVAATVYLTFVGLTYAFFGASFTNDLKTWIVIVNLVVVATIFAIMKRMELPTIGLDIPDAVEIYHWFGVHAKYYNVTFSITSTFQKKATDCEGRLVFKRKSKDADSPEIQRYPLAWAANIGKTTIVKGNPQILRVFLLSDKGKGACLPTENMPEGHFASLIEAGDYDYFRLELFCEEWKDFRTMHEWPNVRFPDFLEALPTK